jgi:hypothetical protein
MLSTRTAFSEEHVQRLTGITIHQLRYWDKTGFFHPEFAADDRRAAFSRVYSFKDVVSLNTAPQRYKSSTKHCHDFLHIWLSVFTSRDIFELNQ